jgi:DNA processing protein
LLSDPGILDPTDPRPEVRQLLRDWLALQWSLALRPGEAVELVRETGCPGAALAASRTRRRASQDELDEALQRLRTVGARAIPVTSSEYPARIARLSDPALMLCARGDIGILKQPCISIVGSRAATSYGLHVARELAAGFARAGVVVVSGLALGIDAAAHRGALEAGGSTVAVLACGLDRVYPARHAALAAEIEANGAILSELSPGTRPLPPFFPLRNRLISALAAAVVVVEARERSGSLITAGHAANQGVEVFAVPGPIHAPTSAGPNRLIKDGAGVALCAADVLEELGWRVEAPAVSRAPDLPPGVPAAEPLDSRQAGIVAVLGRGPASDDEIALAVACAPERLALDLFELESSERVFRARDGLWHLRHRQGGRD